jgi:hypothetical protein
MIRRLRTNRTNRTTVGRAYSTRRSINAVRILYVMPGLYRMYVLYGQYMSTYKPYILYKVKRPVTDANGP